ncbi:MAG: hypothetical protein ACRDGH_13110 [Candidatus Limnocylindria bacterium]
MPASRSRRKHTTKPKTHDQLLRAEFRRQRALDGGRQRRLVGVAFTVVGALLVIDSFVGRAGGPHLLAFDTHHNLGQFGGLILLMLGGLRLAGA